MNAAKKGSAGSCRPSLQVAPSVASSGLGPGCSLSGWEVAFFKLASFVQDLPSTALMGTIVVILSYSCMPLEALSSNG
jgi:hypothetical protein